MYKVLIVEDEMLVRIGLKSSVDWAAFNMEVVADLPGHYAGRREGMIKQEIILGYTERDG